MIVALLIAVVASPALAQAVETDAVANMSVEEVAEKVRKYELPILLVANALVIALLFAGGLLRPGGYEKAGLRDVTPLPALVWMFAGFVVLLALYSSAGVVDSSAWLEGQEYTDLQRDVVVSGAGYATAVIAGLGMLYIFKKSAPEAGLGLSGLDIPVGIGCFILAFPFIQLMSIAGVKVYEQLSEGGDPPQIAHDTLQQLVDNMDDPWVWGLVAGAVIGAPIVEELVFRVFLQGALIKWLKSPWISILIAALIFTMTHRLSSAPVPWHALLAILAVGISCGVAYERTKRVGVPITMHICFNALNVIIALTIAPEAAETGV